MKSNDDDDGDEDDDDDGGEGYADSTTGLTERVTG
jgi:hypothetical protein